MILHNINKNDMKDEINYDKIGHWAIAAFIYTYNYKSKGPQGSDIN